MTRLDVAVIGFVLIANTVWLTILTGWIMQFRFHRHQPAAGQGAEKPNPSPACSAAEFTYASKQATACAVCGDRKHTPLRNDAMGGYVCLTCIDHELTRLQSQNR
jgi:hypothetical protein